MNLPHGMTLEIAECMGMEVERWNNKSCTADFGVGDNWATLYAIKSEEKRKGHATELLKEAKKHYEMRGKKFGGSIALNDNMKRIYKKLEIIEYDD